MKPHQLRVIIEKAELDIKVCALVDFIENSPIFGGLPVPEKHRMQEQYDLMCRYSTVLGERIADF